MTQTNNQPHGPSKRPKASATSDFTVKAEDFMSHFDVIFDINTANAQLDLLQEMLDDVRDQIKRQTT